MIDPVLARVRGSCQWEKYSHFSHSIALGMVYSGPVRIRVQLMHFQDQTRLYPLSGAGFQIF